MNTITAIKCRTPTSQFEIVNAAWSGSVFAATSPYYVEIII